MQPKKYANAYTPLRINCYDCLTWLKGGEGNHKGCYCRTLPAAMQGTFHFIYATCKAGGFIALHCL